MRRYLSIFGLLLTLSLNAQQKWGKNTISSFTNEWMDVVVDKENNSYVVGYISGETAFNETQKAKIAQGNGDIIIAKYNEIGQLIWFKQFGGTNSDRGYKIAIGPDQKPVIAGQFFGQIKFGTTTLNAANNSKDIFLAKLSSDGEVEWATKEGGNDADNVGALAVDNQNNIILSGQFKGTITINSETTTSKINPENNEESFDIFLVKYSEKGTILWNEFGKSSYDDRGLALTTDSQNNIYLSGQFSKEFVFGDAVCTTTNYNNSFLFKLNPSGSLIWKNLLRAGFILANDIQCNAANELIVTGDFSGTFNYETPQKTTSISTTYSKNIFCLSVDLNGNYKWSNKFGSTSEVSSKSIACAPNGEIALVGYFKCSFNELQTNPAYFVSAGFKDAFVIYLNPTGSLKKAVNFGSSKDDEANAVQYTNNNIALISGGYTSKIITTHSGTNLSLQSDGFSLDRMNNNQFGFYGDDSKNAFIASFLDQNSENHTIFNNISTDLTGNIVPETDTLHICTYQNINYLPNTLDFIGTEYTYLWNKSTQNHFYNATKTEKVIVEVSRLDKCSTEYDTIQIILEKEPKLPKIIQKHPVQKELFAPDYGNLITCFPDSISFQFSNLIADQKYYLEENNSTTTSYDVKENKLYTFKKSTNLTLATTTKYCFEKADFRVTIDRKDESKPKPYMICDKPLKNDTLKLCKDEIVHFLVRDSVTNPNHIIYKKPTFQFVKDEWSVESPQNTSDFIFLSRKDSSFFIPKKSGWYTIKTTFTQGYDNSCGILKNNFSLQKRVYIDFEDSSSFIPIYGSNTLCPNSSMYLFTDSKYKVTSWSGPGIIWESLDRDSILVNDIGYYKLVGETISNSICANSLENFFNVVLKETPKIKTVLGDNIICPNDTVKMEMDDLFIHYNWIGPEGDTLSTKNYLNSTTPGLFYCHVIDSQNCALTTNQFEIKEYSTPYLYYEPTNIICDDNPVKVSVAYFGNPNISWNNDPTNVTDYILVNNGGYVKCKINQCGIQTEDSINIVDGRISVKLTTSDSMLCAGETAELKLNTTIGTVIWNDETTNKFIRTIQNEGSYFATVMNQYGCSSQTNTITIKKEESSFPPEINDFVLCTGESKTLYGTDENTIWKTADNKLHVGKNFKIENIKSDTFILVGNANQTCPAFFDTIFIQDAQFKFEFLKSSDKNCFLDTLQYSFKTNASEYTFTTPFGVIKNDSIEIVLNDKTSGKYKIELTDSFGCKYNHTFQLNYFKLPVFELESDTIACINTILPAFQLSDDNTYTWVTENGNATVYLLENKKLILQATSPEGCVYKDSIYVEVLNCSDELPNVITPNGDGKNDSYLIKEASLFPNNKIIILNRWGQKVFEKVNYYNEFNGNGLTDGVYFVQFYWDYINDPKNYSNTSVTILR